MSPMNRCGDTGRAQLGFVALMGTPESRILWDWTKSSSAVVTEYGAAGWHNPVDLVIFHLDQLRIDHVAAPPVRRKD